MTLARAYHEPALGTWRDQSQDAYCRRCERRVSISDFDAPCILPTSSSPQPEPPAATAPRRQDAEAGAGRFHYEALP